MNEGKIGRSIWISKNLDVLLKDRARSLGLGYSNVITDALHQLFGMDRDPLCELMQAIRMWLLSNFKRGEFPEDVMLRTFEHIQRTQQLRALYELIVKEGGQRAQPTLNRRIGQAVVRILGARVVNRKLPAGSNKLVKVYSSLRPISAPAERIETAPATSPSLPSP